MTTKKVVGSVTKVKRVVEPLPEIKIESGVPVPAVTSGRGKYPFEALEKGQSFLLPCLPSKQVAVKVSLMGAARRAEKRMGATYLVRIVEGGVRVWCTAKEAEYKLPGEEI